MTLVDAPERIEDEPERGPVPRAARRGHPSEPRVPYRAGIDGLRGVAVLAVLAYHFDLGWLPGGFFGVDVFLVVSGYLITALLLAEWVTTGRIARRPFWARRARRLLPAVVWLVAGCGALAIVVAPDALSRLRGDMLGALGFFTNWQLAVGEESYFASIGRPPLLQHLWSLAVEEQFYLVWPFVLAVLLPLTRRHRWLRVAIPLALALASTAWAWHLFDPDLDPSRVWYGTDTRAGGLAIGAALAFAWSPWRLRAPPSSAGRRAIDLTGLIGLAGVLWLMAGVDEFSPAVFRGGFLAASVCSALAVAAAAHPGSRLGAWLGARPLRWVGLRSYALYLWHWPVVVVTRPGLDVPLSGWPLAAIRIASTVALAEVSYHYVEMPMRVGLAQVRWRRLPARVRRRATGAVLAFAAALAAAMLVAPGPEAPASLAVGSVSPTTVTLHTSAAEGPAPPPRPLRGDEPGGPGTAIPTTTVAPTAALGPAAPPAELIAPPPAAPVAPAPIVPALGVGDSVLVAAQPALSEAFAGGLGIDAAVGRQPEDGVRLLEQWLAEGRFAGVQVVVIALGSNGLLRPEQLDRAVAALAEVPVVVIVNVRVPRPWEGEVNATIADGVVRHPHLRLVDWYATTAAQPELLIGDGIHPTADGARVYAQLVVAAAQRP